MLEARIIKGIGGFYYCEPLGSSFLLTEDNLIECKPRGVLRHQKIRPVVGDYVKLDQEDNEWVIKEILPRANLIERPNVSNVDIGLICISADKPKPNLVLLDTLLINCEFKNIKPIICITKTDLNIDLANEIKRIYQNIGYTVFLLSTENIDELNKLEDSIKSKTAFLAGPSGVGKSTLSNRLCEFQMDTGNISTKLNRGKHTTRHVQLIKTKSDSLLFDTPGFSTLELENDLTVEDLKKAYPEFESTNCYYNNCNHIKEPKCGVRKKVKEHQIDLERYKRYKSLYQKVFDRERKY